MVRNNNFGESFAKGLFNFLTFGDNNQKKQTGNRITLPRNNNTTARSVVANTQRRTFLDNMVVPLESLRRTRVGSMPTASELNTTTDTLMGTLLSNSPNSKTVRFESVNPSMRSRSRSNELPINLSNAIDMETENAVRYSGVPRLTKMNQSQYKVPGYTNSRVSSSQIYQPL